MVLDIFDAPTLSRRAPFCSYDIDIDTGSGGDVISGGGQSEASPTVFGSQNNGDFASVANAGADAFRMQFIGDDAEQGKPRLNQGVWQ